MDLHDWQLLISSSTLLKDGATWQESSSGTDTIVAWPSEVWVIENDARKQAHEYEKEDELLR